MANAKLRYDEKLVRKCGFQESDGYAVMQNWIAGGKLPTAIAAANDPVAIGAMQALHKAGIKIPQEWP